MKNQALKTQGFGAAHNERTQGVAPALLAHHTARRNPRGLYFSNRSFGLSRVDHASNGWYTSNCPRVLGDREVLEIVRRSAALDRVAQLHSKGYSIERAAREAGVSSVSIWRWRHGKLIPLPCKSGRKPSLPKPPVEIINCVRELVLFGMAPTEAWREAACLPECPSEIVDYLRDAEKIPYSWARMIRPGELLRPFANDRRIIRHVQLLQLAGFSNQGAWLQAAKMSILPPVLAGFLNSGHQVPTYLLAASKLAKSKTDLVKGCQFLAFIERGPTKQKVKTT